MNKSLQRYIPHFIIIFRPKMVISRVKGLLSPFIEWVLGTIYPDFKTPQPNWYQSHSPDLFSFSKPCFLDNRSWRKQKCPKLFRYIIFSFLFEIYLKDLLPYSVTPVETGVNRNVYHISLTSMRENWVFCDFKSSKILIVSLFYVLSL